MNALPKEKPEELTSQRPQNRVIEIFSPPAEGAPVVRLPKPRPLMYNEVSESTGGYVLEAQIEMGFGPFKWIQELGVMGGQWVARASARRLSPATAR